MARVSWPEGKTAFESMDGQFDVFSETVLSVVSQAFLCACTFVFGATVGSFLNVVVYRLPRGRSPASGRSHCPACGVQILARDNVPVLSWLLLRGRCRACGAAISARYPIVEAACGVLFLALAVVEIVAGGWNIPCRPVDPLHGSWWTPLDAEWDLVALFGYHAFALCVLLAWALIDADGLLFPWRHAAAVLAVAAILPMAFPVMHPVPAAHGLPLQGGEAMEANPSWPIQSIARGLLVSVLGAAAGVLVAAGFERFLRPSRAMSLGFVLVGIVFGWQAVVGTAAMLGMLLVFDALWSRSIRWSSRGDLGALVAAAATMHVLVWRWADAILTTWLGIAFRGS